MATDKDLPADVIYRIMKVTYDNKKTLIAAHKAAKFLAMERVLVSPVPIHAGAVRYYREKGLKVPAKLVPPEFK